MSPNAPKAHPPWTRRSCRHTLALCSAIVCPKRERIRPGAGTRWPEAPKSTHFSRTNIAQRRLQPPSAVIVLAPASHVQLGRATIDAWRETVTVDTVDTLARDRAIRYQRLTKALEWPMAILALAVIPALLLDDGAATPRTHAIASAANWIIWLAFCAEFGARFALAPDRQRFVRRSFRHRKFHYVLILTAAVMVLGATGLYVVEREQNEALTSFWDALWWAVSTTTTVGYGDIYPTTGEGRLIAVLLMLTGIGVIGVFTATIASLFMIQDEEDEFNGIHKRLDGLEAKLDRILERERPTSQKGHRGALHH